MPDDKSKRGSPDSQRQATPPRPSRRTARKPGDEKKVSNTAPAVMKAPDAVDLLVDDHLAVDACFKRYKQLVKAGAPAAERQALANAICDRLTVHTTIEDEIFYPAAREAGVEAAQLDEADVEHASAKDLIEQIRASSPDEGHYDAKVTVLGEYIQHHVVEEHTEMFPDCRRAAEMDLELLRAALESRKVELEAAPPRAGLLAQFKGAVLGEGPRAYD
jgi:hypothetical protein